MTSDSLRRSDCHSCVGSPKAGRFACAPRHSSLHGLSRNSMVCPLMPNDEAVRETLRQVEDPEAGMNIVDLGLVYGVEVAPDCVRVDITMTTAACPMADMITEQAHSAIAAIVPE